MDEADSSNKCFCFSVSAGNEELSTVLSSEGEDSILIDMEFRTYRGATSLCNSLCEIIKDGQRPYDYKDFHSVCPVLQ